MDIRQSIYWHQGMFLQPQHFQHLEMHQQFARQPLARLAQPYAWGLESLELAESALANRVIEVRQLRLLWPDLTCIEYPGNAVIAARSFEKHWPDPDQPLNVYLAIRRLSAASGNASVVDTLEQAGQVRSRYATLSSPASEQDVYAHSSEAPMPTLLHVVRLVFEEELGSLDDHDVIPLTQLRQDAQQVRVVHPFVPPVVTVDASPFLTRLLRDVRDELLGRTRQLEEYKTPRGMQAEDLDAQFLMMMQAVQALNRHVPALTHLIETPGVSPWLAYGLLRQCVGELSTFSQRVDVLGRMAGKDESLPTYQHEQPGPCFARAREVLSQVLAEIAAGPDFHVALMPHEGFHTGLIPDEYLGNRHRFYLLLQGQDNAALDVQFFLGSARLAATQELPDLIDHALPGIELIPLPSAPQGLPRRSNARYFRIEQLSERWAAVQSLGSVSLDWPEAPEGIRVVVVATRS